MSRAIASLVAVAVPVVALTACRPEATDPRPPTAVVCRLDLDVPDRFRPLETFHEEGADHVGLRAGFVDRRGRELHLFAGIPGEFGEGLPAAGEVRLTQGRAGLASGRDRVWVVEWTQGGTCDPRAVLVNGLSRRGFLDLLLEMQVAAATG